MCYKHINKQYSYQIKHLNVTICNTPEYSKIIKVIVSLFVHKFVRVHLEFGFAK